MFKDYYAILEVPSNASKAEIKKNYRRLAKKWHPDVNQGIDTTSKMQEITEAYLILNDSQAKKRYDYEYERFKEFNKSRETYKSKSKTKKENQKNKPKHERKEDSTETFEVKDEILKDWIDNAKQQARDFVNQAKYDTVGISKRGVQYAKKSALIGLIVFIILFFLIIVIFSSNS